LSALPRSELNASAKSMKAYEDALDAVVCACVAICALEGCARPYGDPGSAVWIPNPWMEALWPSRRFAPDSADCDERTLSFGSRKLMSASNC
jgi:hypothetical protein